MSCCKSRLLVDMTIIWPLCLYRIWLVLNALLIFSKKYTFIKICSAAETLLKNEKTELKFQTFEQRFIPNTMKLVAITAIEKRK